jgi:UDP-N-acetylmuramoyl-tripeptide--D-alanyl-D-alanine ligase
MMELGNESLEEHHAIIALLKQYKWKDVVLVGGNFLKIEHPYHSFANSAEAKAWLNEQKLEHATLLIKGSRSMQMEKVIAD